MKGNTGQPKQLTRNHHFNHLVKMVPLIAVIFGVQCFMAQEYYTNVDTKNMLMALGFGLISFILGFNFYDRKHVIVLRENDIHVKWSIFRNYTIPYVDIWAVESQGDDEQFGTLVIKMRKGCGRHKVFYFIDEPDEMKKLIQSCLPQKSQERLAA